MIVATGCNSFQWFLNGIEHEDTKDIRNWTIRSGILFPGVTTAGLSKVHPAWSGADMKWHLQV
ncbi:MAG: hypothetical protein LUQ07_04000 [Methanospirillum sp.]|nr:hypothetical protein [Methanospirillum sp.]